MAKYADLLDAEIFSEGADSRFDQVLCIDVAIEVLRTLTGGTGAIGYRHPNGFSRIAVCESDRSGARLRLHVWDGLDAQENIHNHRWDYASLVLTGEMQIRNYELEPALGTYFVYKYRAPGRTGNYGLTPAGTSGAREIASTTLTAETLYAADGRDLHRVSALSHPLATWVLQGPAIHPPANVLTPCPQFAGSSVLVHRLTNEEIAAIAERVLRSIGIRE